MREAVIVSGVRTPVGRSHKGSLASVRPDDLAALVVREAVERAGVAPGEVEDVILGCAMPEAEQGLNVARIAAMRAGLPNEVPGQTVNRFCASGLQTIATAAQSIMTGMADVIVVTSSPVTVTANGAPGTPLDLRLAIDLSKWDSIDLSVGLLGLAALIPVGRFAMVEAGKSDRAAACGRAGLRDIKIRGMLDPTTWAAYDLTPVAPNGASPLNFGGQRRFREDARRRCIHDVFLYIRRRCTRDRRDRGHGHSRTAIPESTESHASRDRGQPRRLDRPGVCRESKRLNRRPLWLGGEYTARVIRCKV